MVGIFVLYQRVAGELTQTEGTPGTACVNQHSEPGGGKLGKAVRHAVAIGQYEIRDHWQIVDYCINRLWS
jgi:hypothetical protein